MVVESVVEDHSIMPTTISNGFLGFQFATRRLPKSDGMDGISVFSNVSTSHNNNNNINNNNNNGDHLLHGKSIVVRQHDSSSSSPLEEEQDDNVNTVTTTTRMTTTTSPVSSYMMNEFVIRCRDDEMVYVTAHDGRRLLTLCPSLRQLLEESNRRGAGQVLYQPQWTSGNVRRLIELLVHGKTWIENEKMTFQSFIKAAEDLSLDVRLTSLINYQDTMSASSTREFFHLLDEKHYQFRLSTAIQSIQWIRLMELGVLLMPKCTLLSVRLGSSVQNNNHSHPFPPYEVPSKERLDKCDELQSDFYVYAHSNMHAIFTIINILAPPLQNHHHNDKKKRQSTIKQTTTTEAEIKVICKIRVHSPNLSMFWRMTDCSFHLTPMEDHVYLDSFQKPISTHLSEDDKTTHYPHCNVMVKKSVPSWQPNDVTNNCVPDVVAGASNSSSSSTSSSSSSTSSPSSASNDPLRIPRGIVIEGGEPSSMSTVDVETPQTASVVSKTSIDYGGYYTLSGHSFLAVHHLLQSMKDDIELDTAACFVIQTPTPDTLGRLMNAVIHTTIPRLDFEIPKTDLTSQRGGGGGGGNGAVFYACKTTREIQNMLEYMADYSSSAVVKGDFQLCERRIQS